MHLYFEAHSFCLRLCVFYDNSSSFWNIIRIAPARPGSVQLRPARPRRAKPRQAGPPTTHSCPTEQAQDSPCPCGRGWVYYFYLYQISYCPVKGNLWDYECFFPTRLCKKAQLVYLCSCALKLYLSFHEQAARQLLYQALKPQRY